MRVDDAAEMAGVLADLELYEFIGGRPPTPAELGDRFRRWQAGGSDDGTEVWHNWIVRLRPGARAEPAASADPGRAVGTMQATVYRDVATADVAWIVGRDWQGLGLASEAARAVVAWLIPDVDAITAHVHPLHQASARVAAHAGLEPTDLIEDGEVVWRLQSRPPGGAED